MKSHTEKRASDRHNQEATITWSYFNTNEYFRAKMINYSEGGLRIESEFKLQPGATIFIRLDKVLPNLSDHKLHDGFRTVTLGETKWCNEIHVAGSYKYGIGIRFYEPDY